MPRLDFYVDQKPFAKLKLEDESVLVGRATDCDVQLMNEAVSRQHARIRPGEGGEVWLENLSPNGTRLNYEMVDAPAQLHPGDRIYIHKYVMIYQRDSAPPESLEMDVTRAVPYG